MKDQSTYWKVGLTRVLVLAALMAVAPPAALAAERVSATLFAGAGDIEPTMDQFRLALGEPDNGGHPAHTPWPKGDHLGRRARRLRRDQLPPAGLFQRRAAPLARGASPTTSGPGCRSARWTAPTRPRPRCASATSNPSYARLPGLQRGAAVLACRQQRRRPDLLRPRHAGGRAVQGFGAVYTDVDRRKSSFKYFDAKTASGQVQGPGLRDGLSFLGVVFDGPWSRGCGSCTDRCPWARDETVKKDVAVMDNFIFGEPQAAPPVE